jgi:hypothetical protein
VLHFELTEDVGLRLPEESDADALAALVAANRPYLARWLPWAAGNDRETWPSSGRPAGRSETTTACRR